MQLTIENLKREIKPGDRLILFKNDKAYEMFQMSAGQHFIQVCGGLQAYTLERFIKAKTANEFDKITFCPASEIHDTEWLTI